MALLAFLLGEVFDARWSSSNDSVATAAAGMVTAQAPGTVTIKAEWTETGYGYIPGTFNFGGHAGLGGGGSCQPFQKTMRASASYQVRPMVQVTSADIAEDRISISLEPAGATGQLRVFLSGPSGQFELVNRSQQGGETTAPFNTANLPNQEFTSIGATWTVNTLAGSGSLSYHMVVLGDFRQTCYNLPLESEFSGPVVNAGTVNLENNRCNWSSLSFLSNFLDEVNENGSGFDSTMTAIQREGSCRDAPATSPAYDGVRYRRPADIRTACNSHLVADHTLARGPGLMTTLPCGTPVFIAGLGKRFIEDRGGGLADNQLDNFKGAGAAVCNSWSNPHLKTVKLF